MSQDRFQDQLNQRIDRLEKQARLYDALDQELTQGIHLYRFIVENSHVGIVIINDQYRIVYGNNEITNITGYPLDEIIGRDFRDLVAAGDPHGETEPEALRRKGEILPYRYEAWAVNKDGTRKTVEASVAVTKSFANQTLSVVQVFDITERKRMESELQKSRKKYYDLFHNVSDIIYIFDLNGVFLETNASYVMEQGGTRDFLVGKSIREFLPEKYVPGFEAFFKRILKNGKDEGLITIRIPTGEKRALEYRNSLIYSEEGTPVGVWGSARDITEHLKDKKALTESEEKYRTIIEGSPIPTFVIDQKHAVTHWNEACESLTGVRAMDMIGTNNHWRAFYPGPQPTLADLVLDKSHKNTIVKYTGKTARLAGIGRGAYEAELFFSHLGENGAWLIFTAAPVKNSEGVITGVIATMVDISEKKRAERNLLKMHDALEEKVKDRTQGLEEANIAMKVLLSKREEDRRELEGLMLTNVREMILPYIERLKSSPLRENQKVYLEIIERNLKDITSPFVRGLADGFQRLSPSEIQIIALIKQNKSSKEIAEFLNISIRTAEFHRDNIRKKLGIKNQKINLRAYLQSMG